MLAELAEGPPGAPLLAYRRGRRRVPITARDVNEYVHAVTGSAFTAKDFRTLRGTLVAASALAAAGTPDSVADRRRAERAAVDAAAAALGNTPAVARASYIDPAGVPPVRAGPAARRHGRTRDGDPPTARALSGHAVRRGSIMVIPATVARSNSGRSAAASSRPMVRSMSCCGASSPCSISAIIAG